MERLTVYTASSVDLGFVIKRWIKPTRRHPLSALYISAGLLLLLGVLVSQRSVVLSGWNAIPKAGLALLAGGGLIVAGIYLRVRAYRSKDSDSFQLLPWWVVLVGVLLAVAATWASIGWLSDVAGGNKQLEFEAIKTGLTVGAGVGGLAVLLLGVRRQWLNERIHMQQIDVASTSEYDATERRLTEIYTKAADQLGHEKAATRLAGLYALERLGNDHMEHRQTIVNLLCAYLRMPFVSPGQVRVKWEVETGDDQNPVPPNAEFLARLAAAEQELEVRVTAQEILARHLRFRGPESAFNWGQLEIVLSRAYLVNFDFSRCEASAADFRSATFEGYADFDNVVLGWPTSFESATFLGEAGFHEAAISANSFKWARFYGQATFSYASFSSFVDFGVTEFLEQLLFDHTTFGGGVSFKMSELHSNTTFAMSIFGGDGNFDQVEFRGAVSFRKALFEADASFRKAHFRKPVIFGRCQFRGGQQILPSRKPVPAKFEACVFDGRAAFVRAQFPAGARFSGCKFRNAAIFEKLPVGGYLEFQGARAARSPLSVLPQGWGASESPERGLLLLVKIGSLLEDDQESL